MDWTDEDVTAGMAVLPKEWDDTDKHQRLWIVKSVLAAVAPSIAARTLRQATDDWEAQLRADEVLGPDEQSLEGAFFRARADQIQGKP